jgi:YfiH family protein
VAGITPPRDASGAPLHLTATEACDADIGIAFGATGWPVYWVSQVHGAEVVRVAAGRPTRPLPRADALVTDAPGVLLATRHADCTPVLVWDPVRRAVGLAHSGRKGTLLDVAGAVVNAMQAAYDSDPRDLVASIGPGIRSCCYEVGPDVLEEADRLGVDRRWFSHREAGVYLDLQGLIASQLRDRGLTHVHGEREAECTRCGPTQLHSYRRDGTKLRFAAVAGVRP